MIESEPLDLRVLEEVYDIKIEESIKIFKLDKIVISIENSYKQ